MRDKGKRARWERRIRRERTEDDNYVNDNVHISHSNSIGGNAQDHVGKEEKEVKQLSYVTSQQRNYKGLQYDNTSQTLSRQIEQRKCLPTWTECDQISY